MCEELKDLLDATAAQLLEDQKVVQERTILDAKLILRSTSLKVSVKAENNTHMALREHLGAEYEHAIGRTIKKLEAALSNLAFDIRQLTIEAEEKKASADAGTSEADASFNHL